MKDGWIDPSIDPACGTACARSYLLTLLTMTVVAIPFSAVCACVDMEDRVPGAGSQWFCLHATCACTEEEAALAAASAATAASSMLATTVAAVLMAVMVYN